MTRRNVLILGAAAFSPRLDGIAPFAKAHGWNVQYNRLIDRPFSYACDGAIVLLTNDTREIDCVRRLIRRGIPVVDLTIVRTKLKIPRVIGDHCGIGHLAADHFNLRGFSHAAWLSSSWSNVHRLRLQGFASHFKGHCERWIWPEHAASDPRSRTAFADWLRRKILTAPKPLAITAYDDADATYALNVCLHNNVSVPEDVAILGVDNDRFICENQTIPLSSIRQDQSLLARRGAELLESLMNGAKAPRKPILVAPLGITTRASTDVMAADDPRLRQALTFLRDNLSRPIGISQVAEEIGVSHATVKRLFASGLGCGVTAILSRLRLARVKVLLADGGAKQTEIARQCGYCNASYMANSFKAAFGITPARWRKSACSR